MCDSVDKHHRENLQIDTNTNRNTNKQVTSISADTHKYGFAPKGSSVILYRDMKVPSQIVIITIIIVNITIITIITIIITIITIIIVNISTGSTSGSASQTGLAAYMRLPQSVMIRKWKWNRWWACNVENEIGINMNWSSL